MIGPCLVAQVVAGPPEVVINTGNSKIFLPFPFQFVVVPTFFIGAMFNDGTILLVDGLEVNGIFWESDDRH